MLAGPTFKIVTWKLWKCFLGGTRAPKKRERDEKNMIVSSSPRCAKELGQSQPGTPSSIFPKSFSKVMYFVCQLWRNRQQLTERRALGCLFRDISETTYVCQKLVMRLRVLWKQGLSSQILLPNSQRLIPGPTESMAKFPFSRAEARSTPKTGVSCSSLLIFCTYTDHICSPPSLSCYARKEETPLACLI